MDFTEKPKSFDILRGARTNNLEEINNALIENPDSINDQDEDTLETALHISINNRYSPTVDRLCKETGFDFSLKDCWGRTVSELTFIVGNSEIMNSVAYSEFPDLEELTQEPK